MAAFAALEGGEAMLSSPLSARFLAIHSVHAQFFSPVLAGFVTESVKLEVRGRVPS